MFGYGEINNKWKNEENVLKDRTTDFIGWSEVGTPVAEAVIGWVITKTINEIFSESKKNDSLFINNIKAVQNIVHKEIYNNELRILSGKVIEVQARIRRYSNTSDLELIKNAALTMESIMGQLKSFTSVDSLLVLRPYVIAAGLQIIIHQELFNKTRKKGEINNIQDYLDRTKSDMDLFEKEWKSWSDSQFSSFKGPFARAGTLAIEYYWTLIMFGLIVLNLL